MNHIYTHVMSKENKISIEKNHSIHKLNLGYLKARDCGARLRSRSIKKRELDIIGERDIVGHFLASRENPNGDVISI